MSAVRFCLLAVVVLALYVSESRAAINCYSCTSVLSGCGDPFSSSGVTVVSCESGTCHKSKSSAAGIDLITRSCGTTGLANKCESAGAAGVSSSVCGCTTSLCNSAVSVSRNQLVVFGLTTFAAAVALVVRRVA